MKSEHGYRVDECVDGEQITKRANNRVAVNRLMAVARIKIETAMGHEQITKRVGWADNRVDECQTECGSGTRTD